MLMENHDQMNSIKLPDGWSYCGKHKRVFRGYSMCIGCYFEVDDNAESFTLPDHQDRLDYLLALENEKPQPSQT